MNNETLISIMKSLAEESKCVSMKVGAVLVKDGRIRSTGVNGSPAGTTNCNDVWEERCPEHTAWSNTHEIHAEMNAIFYAAKKGISTENTELYCTHEPCQHCLKNLIQAGVAKIFYLEPYYNEDESLKEAKHDLIRKTGIVFTQIE